MGARKSKDELVEMLHILFRSRGYEGVSLDDISKATGLGKSSLYHHFPDGKSGMAQAVIDAVRGKMTTSIFEPLADKSDASNRIDAMLKAVTSIYENGKSHCVLASFLTSSPEGPLNEQAAALMHEWCDHLAKTVQDHGLSPPVARQRAQLALSQIQGLLVLAPIYRENDNFFSRGLTAVRSQILQTS